MMHKWLKRYWTAFIPVFILCMIAAHQLIIQKSSQMDPWKGGGFGMFSTISDRFIHIHLMNKGTFQCAELPISMRETIRKLIKHPTEKKMILLAKHLSTRTWIYQYETPNQPLIVMVDESTSIQQKDKVVIFDSVSIEIYKILFDQTKNHVKPDLIQDVLYHKK